MQEYHLANLHCDALINLYLLADKLQDLATANMVIDQMNDFYANTDVHPGKGPISTVYRSTTDGSPLRNLLHDLWYRDADDDCEKLLQESCFPKDFLHVLVKMYVRVKVSKFSSNHGPSDGDDDPGECDYHQHDGGHPTCSTSLEDKVPCKSCRTTKKV
jgi:hypothetical protein